MERESQEFNILNGWKIILRRRAVGDRRPGYFELQIIDADGDASQSGFVLIEPEVMDDMLVWLSSLPQLEEN